MASYYYLISSLPTLSSDSQMPFDYSTFLEMCKSSVSSKVYKTLEELTLDSENGPLIKEWGAFYRKLINALNYLRREKLGLKTEESSVEDAAAKDAAIQAMNAKNPLEAEQIMLKAQFDHLDQLVAMHYFDDTVLFGYAVKLKLLERQNIFDMAEGKKEFKRLFDSIQDQILSI